MADRYCGGAFHTPTQYGIRLCDVPFTLKKMLTSVWLSELQNWLNNNPEK